MDTLGFRALGPPSGVELHLSKSWAIDLDIRSGRMVTKGKDHLGGCEDREDGPG